jgi:ribonuclease J
MLDGIVRDRVKMALNGHVIVTVIIDEDGEPLGEPWCEVKGIAEVGTSNAPLVDVLEQDLGQLIMRADERTVADDDKLEEQLKRQARRTCQQEIGKKVEVTCVISRLS